MAETGPLIVDEGLAKRAYIGPLHVSPLGYPDADHDDLSKKYWARADDSAPANEYCYASNTPFWSEVPRQRSDGLVLHLGQVRYFSCGEQQFQVTIPDTGFNLGYGSPGAEGYVTPDGSFWAIDEVRTDFQTEPPPPVLMIRHVTTAGVATDHRLDILPSFMPTTGPDGEPVESPSGTSYRPEYLPYYQYGVDAIFPQQNGIGLLINADYGTGDPTEFRSGIYFVVLDVIGGSLQVVSSNWIARTEISSGVFRTPSYYPDLSLPSQLHQDGFFQVGVSTGNTLSLDRVRQDGTAGLVEDTYDNALGVGRSWYNLTGKYDTENGKLYELVRWSNKPSSLQKQEKFVVVESSGVSAAPQWMNDIVAAADALDLLVKHTVNRKGDRFLFGIGYESTQSDFGVFGEYLVTDEFGNELLRLSTLGDFATDLGILKEFRFSYDLLYTREDAGVQRTDDNEFMFPRTIYTPSGFGYNISHEVRKYSADSIVSTPSLGDVHNLDLAGGRYWPRGQYVQFDYSGWT